VSESLESFDGWYCDAGRGVYRALSRKAEVPHSSFVEVCMKKLFLEME